MMWHDKVFSCKFVILKCVVSIFTLYCLMKSRGKILILSCLEENGILKTKNER